MQNKNWKSRSLELRSEGMGWREIAAKLIDEKLISGHVPAIAERVRSHYRNTEISNKIKEIEYPKHAEKQATPIDVLDLLKAGSHNTGELCKKAGLTRGQVLLRIEELQDAGHNIEQIGEMWRIEKTIRPDATIIEHEWDGTQTVRFGLLGDTHFGSKFCQISLLHDAYDKMAEEGITDVYHTGDMSDGCDMRQGHAYELYVHGAEETVDEIARNYPFKPGITTHWIMGNHDLDFNKKAGLNIGKMLQARRPDLRYIGSGDAKINLTPNCTLELMHPGGGSAYAWSYKPQKIIEAMTGGSKPNILAVGHFHKVEYIQYRNIHAFQSGTMQAQSDFMRDRALVACLGYWIITVEVGVDGEVRQIAPVWYPFYKPVKDDYLSYR